MGLPPLPFTLPPVNPLPGGLYDTATIIDAPDGRHLGGLLVESPNQGASGQWPTVCPAPEGTPLKEAVSRAEQELFEATVVWAADECRTVGQSEENVLARAQHLLRLREPIEAEKFLATQLAKVKSTPVFSLVGAITQVEDTLSSAGYAGVIHVDRRLLVRLHDHRLVVRQGGVLFSPGGHRYAAGIGYHALGDTIVGTGPIQVRRSPIEAHTITIPKENRLYANAERIIAIAYDSPAIAATIQEDN